MLSKRAQRDILIELLKGSRDNVFVRDDHYLDCQLVMPDKSFLAVYDFGDAVLNADRFQPVPDMASKWVMEFNPSGCEEVRPLSTIIPELINVIMKNKILPLKGATGNLYYIRQKYLRMIHFDERRQTLYLRKTDQGKPAMYYLWDNEKEELDAMICPFRMEVNDGTETR